MVYPRFFICLMLTLMVQTACTKTNEQPTNTNNNPTDTTSTNPSDTTAESAFYAFKMNGIDGMPIDFSQYKGKKVLLVNTASNCGYTPQYEALEDLHRTMGDKVVVLGFPANNFMGQEPGSNAEIATFCTQNYGVSFQMFEKIDVVGNNQAPLYKFLSDPALNGWNDQAPTWNFCKYLVDEQGKLRYFFKSNIKPNDPQIINAINE